MRSWTFPNKRNTVVFTTVFSLFSGDLVFAYHAKGALEIFGNILPLGAGSNATLGITGCFIIFPAAKIANIFHNNYLLGY